MIWVYLVIAEEEIQYGIAFTMPPLSEGVWQDYPRQSTWGGAGAIRC